MARGTPDADQLPRPSRASLRQRRDHTLLGVLTFKRDKDESNPPW